MSATVLLGMARQRLIAWLGFVEIALGVFLAYLLAEAHGLAGVCIAIAVSGAVCLGWRFSSAAAVSSAYPSSSTFGWSCCLRVSVSKVGGKSGTTKVVDGLPKSSLPSVHGGLS